MAQRLGEGGRLSLLTGSGALAQMAQALRQGQAGGGGGWVGSGGHEGRVR